MPGRSLTIEQVLSRPTENPTRIETIIAEDRPTIRAANPRTWINKTDYPELEFRPSLRSFTTQRANLLAVLEPLPHESW